MIQRALDVWCPGRPKTKGSLSVVNGSRGVLRDTPASKRWRELMGYAAKHAMAARSMDRMAPVFPLIGRVGVSAHFLLPVPDAAAARTGDLDKLLRNLLDALQDVGVYVDDAQVVQVQAAKSVAGERGPGVEVSVFRLED